MNINKTHNIFLTLPLKMTSEMVESTWANIEYSLLHLDPDIRITRRLKHLYVKYSTKHVFF